MSARIRQTVASHPKFSFTLTSIFCSPTFSNNCGVVFLWKYKSVFEKWFFSFDHSNMQIFTLNITRVVWPHVMNKLDLQYFCQHNPLFYHLNLIPCYYWSWQRNIYFFGEYFCPTIPTSKSNIKTKTVLTMPIWQNLLCFELWLISYCKNFLVYLCCSILRRTQSPAKFTF